MTVAAFVLRLDGIDQSLFGDEVLTYSTAAERTVSAVFEQMSSIGESTPPLYFLLAWLSAKLGDPTISIRLPSLILGTASVPLVYALGVRTVGATAALVGSAIMAISPFAIFYGVEGRSYATLGFLSALSTLTLLRALRRGDSLSWVAFGMSTLALLYTHYTAVFVVVGQFGWALWTHRDRLRPLILVHAGVALAYWPGPRRR